MDKITLKNFRCFREEQTARLAPLTLLVGENSTGKTSFMALIRALWDVAFAERVPDFREPPYNLGSFRDIVHNRGGRGKPAESFEAGFEYSRNHRMGPIAFSATFEERDDNPFPATLHFGNKENWIEVLNSDGGLRRVKYCNQGVARYAAKQFIMVPVVEPFSHSEYRLFSLSFARDHFGESDCPPDKIDFRKIPEARPFSSAPVRSRPLRTYDPESPSVDPEGKQIPTLLARLYHQDRDDWQLLKDRLEDFGRASGLFDEIAVQSFGKSQSVPFQLQIRKFSGKGHKGPRRNLIDVGYGVSQVLPLLSELLGSDADQIFLLQQPEVHLHPRAQAALGSLFCELAGPERQLIVETHSEYLIDRVRIDIRDKKSALTHEDVSILYFEPGDLDVKIHSIRFDEYGNVLDAPPSYGKFFMEEVSRSIGIGL